MTRVFILGMEMTGNDLPRNCLILPPKRGMSRAAQTNMLPASIMPGPSPIQSNSRLLNRIKPAYHQVDAASE